MRTPDGSLVELSHTIEDGLITYQGLPAPILCDFMSHEDSQGHYAPGTEFQIGRIEMVANTGTYIDSPYHRYRDRKDISDLSLDSTANLEGVVIDGRNRETRSIGESFFEGADLEGKAVLVLTGWDRHWGTDRYFEGHPFLTRGAAEHLAAAGAVLVGIDSLNIDDTDDDERPVHTKLLGQEIPIVEHLCGLQQIVNRRFRFFASPVKVKGMGSFPVRAYALTEGIGSDPDR